MAALKEGTVVVAMWSYIDEFCEQLGTHCRNFNNNGEIRVLEIEEGIVVSMMDETDGFMKNYAWDELPPMIRNALIVLGENREVWDCGDEEAWDCDDDEDCDDDGVVSDAFSKPWDELSAVEQEAATTLGIRWNVHGGNYLDSHLDVSSFDEGQNSPFSNEDEDWKRYIDELCN
jgi:hypothetical protein